MLGKCPKFIRVTVQYFVPNKQKIWRKCFLKVAYVGLKTYLVSFSCMYTMLTGTVGIWQWQKTNVGKKIQIFFSIYYLKYLVLKYKEMNFLLYQSNFITR